MSHTSFASLGLSDAILDTLTKIGYESPSPIQQQCITHLLSGKDVIGQAQTGTGKTAAFSLPLLDTIDVKSKQTQILVLAPTRELAIQVSNAMQTYASNMKAITVLPIYGGGSYDTQLKALKKGVQIVVGTPGRVIDHIHRKTLKLDNIKAFVLDEADEMLRMGFIDDVKLVLTHLPKQRQIALFSATMPKEIKEIATKFLHNPEVVKIASKTETSNNILQQYLQVAGKNKTIALKRILESADIDGVIIFARTKNDTSVLSEQLVNFGYKSQALNGDIPQKDRERIIAMMKKGSIDIIVATDVAARGIDVPRITHVINYDIPQDVETYIHRIGRTGRAGRKGCAILFAKSSDLRMLKQIERHTKQQVEKINLPGVAEINSRRIENFKKDIASNINNNKDFALFKDMLKDFINDNQYDTLDVVASLAILATSGKSGRGKFLLTANDEIVKDANEISIVADALKKHPQIPMQRFRIEVGKRDGVSVKTIISTIASSADIANEYIGSINILENFSTIDLPDEMPNDIFEILKQTTIAGRALSIAKFSGVVKKSRKKSYNAKRNGGGFNVKNGKNHKPKRKNSRKKKIAK
jgi:ATP-dependent RNA helicase DeaD